MIILAAWGAGGGMSSHITTIKGKPITPIEITTIPVVSGIRPIIDITIHTLTAIIGTLTLTMGATGGLDYLCWRVMN